MMRTRIGMTLLLAAALLAAGVASSARAAVSVRLKDVVRIKNVRREQLFGMGLVVGLNKTGDGGLLARQMLANMLQKMRVSIPVTDLVSQNVAAVIVTADPPPFLAEGSRVDVTVSSIGDAKSLQGGTLLQTPLQGADGQVYVVAQGPLSVGGFSAAGEAASVNKNHPTVARVPGGGLCERAITTVMRPGDTIDLVLRDPDFTTAERLAATINEAFPGCATPGDAGTVSLAVPAEYAAAAKIVPFLAQIESLKVVPDAVARVVVNEKTGTIVAGENVKVSKVAISHGSLTISITETTNTSQPLPLSAGETRSEKSTDITAHEEKSGMYVIEDAATIAEVARVLNLLGVTPRDMISIFQTLKEAGALQGELVIM